MLSERARAFLRELNQRGSLGLAPGPWNLAVSLPLIQPSVSLTCVVSNHVNQKNATLVYGEECWAQKHPQKDGYALVWGHTFLGVWRTLVYDPPANLPSGKTQ